MSLNEAGIIDTYLRPLASDPLAFNLEDDAAELTIPEGTHLVVTKDLLCAGTHFFPDDPPRLIAQKALRTNISDLIAKGAEPYRYTLGLALDVDFETEFMSEFCAGLADDQSKYGLSLLGGDMTRCTSGLVISITAFGLAQSSPITRLTAQIGDEIYVTGTIGDAALGLQLRLDTKKREFLSSIDCDALLQKYLLPNPPLQVTSLVSEFASASMDISDGLIGDLQKLCIASNVSAVLDVSKVPLSPEAQNWAQNTPEIIRQILTGGDDYQTLFTVPASRSAQCEQLALEKGLSISKIGVIGENEKPLVVLKNAPVGLADLNIDNLSFDHFSR